MTLLLLRYRLRIFLRLLRDHFFTLFVLAPMIVAGVLYTIQPAVDMFAAAVRARNWSFPELVVIVTAGFGAWTALFWPSAVNEIAPTRTAENYLDALPVSPLGRLLVSFLGQICRNAIVVVVLLIAWSPETLQAPAPYLFSVFAAGMQLAFVLVHRRYGMAEGRTSSKFETRSRSTRPRQRSGISLPRRLGEVRPQLRRDLLLTRRLFSPAVPFALAAALTAMALAWTVRNSAGPRWTAEIVLAGCALATLALSSLAPLLLRLQIPRFWLEQTSPVDPDSIWKTKIWFAAIVSIPPLLISIPLLAALPDESFAVVALQALVVTLSVSSIVALLMFEVADRPVLGLTLAGLLGTAFAGTYVLFWEYTIWMGALHAYAVHHLAVRARETAGRLGGPAL